MKVILSFLLIALVSCAPVSEGIRFSALPEEEEIKLGKRYIPTAIAQNEGVYPDEEVQNYVRSLGNRLSALAPRKLPYRFYVVSSSAHNAFALPGGPVFVTRGLLLILDNESELVGVLGHELGHINKRHHARYLEKVMGLSLLLQITAILVGDGSTSSQLLLQMANIGAGLLTLKFSRDQEREADDFGIKITARAGYDPSGLVRVFEKFKKLQRRKVPSWLSTHPLPSERISRVSRELDRYKNMHLKKDSETFRKIKQKLLSTESSYRLYEEGKKLYRKKDRQTALLKFKEAVRLYPKNQMAHIYISSILTEEGRHKEALHHANEAVRIDPQLVFSWFMRGVVLFNMGSYQRSISDLQEAVKLVPSFADAHYFLGRNYEAIGRYREALASYERAIKLSKGKEPWLSDAKRRYRILSGGPH